MGTVKHCVFKETLRIYTVCYDQHGIATSTHVKKASA